MPASDRRQFLQSSLGAVSALPLFSGMEALLAAESTEQSGNMTIAPFRFDVTPPMGHSLCGGWIKPVEAVDDSLEAIGFVLTGAGKPIVLCAVDWTGLLNDAHVQWRTALAEAAGTTPERVAVQCVHQHNAPFACLDAEKLILEQGDLPHIVELDYFEDCLKRGRGAVQEAMKSARPVTHVAHGQAKVDKVASNRRVFRDENGKIKAMRGSSCTNEELRALPEGLIDPWLKTVAYYDGDEKVVSCHYYATHPMSYYGDGRVSSDFAGLARKKRQAEQPDCTHIYFTGCAGNIAAGKYNDGSHEVRPILTERMYDGIVKSEESLKPQPIQQASWHTQDILPTPRASLSQEDLVAEISNRDNAVVGRNRPSYMLTWLRRVEKQIPIVLSSLHVNDIALLHLPAECFIEYQLHAQSLAPNRFVATAAYGDGGPWYIPTAAEYPNGGYEVGVAFCEPGVDELLRGNSEKLLS
ncbi:hypothetical protein CA54_40130 [Symmachiella macrocystis]|uniref:Neutral/alkaline non-lysosomal ceramidase n=1 Tax=Symmachiella macrocystis TaxID=2527985 RepID=A0A5C6BBW6_9PLAN|nr:hypothetical protein [Symmachiella macrocystis]TWU08776.1 hypothetical protein CA54_40130 [Symmachiella macrocystis]